MITVGIDGPVLAGKSTLCNALVSRLSERGLDVEVIDCYVDFTQARGGLVPPPIAENAAAQLATVDAFLEIERARIASQRGAAITIFDRTPLSLAAHASGVAAMGGADVREEAQARISSRLPLDLNFYLRVTHASQLVRKVTRKNLPDVFVDPQFSAGFGKYFERLVESNSLLAIDAELSTEHNVSIMLDQIVRLS